MAIHVYNESHFGGLLGPRRCSTATRGYWPRAVLRDIAAYSIATLLLTLAALHLLPLLTQRDLLEHLSFAGTMTAVAVFLIAHATWGPVLLLGYGAMYRVAVATLLAGVALFPHRPVRGGPRAGTRSRSSGSRRCSPWGPRSLSCGATRATSSSGSTPAKRPSSSSRASP